MTINNVEPRRDVAGQIIDAHGGCLQFFDGRFYLYGTAFGASKDGHDLNNPFRVYGSADLEKWSLEGELLKEPLPGVHFRPYVVFNPHTRKYVLWYNWYPKLWNGQAGVAVSDSPVGPFKIVTPKAHLLGSRPGDGSLFVDDDGTGYYIYVDMDNDYGLRVERLTTDFSDSTGQASDILGYGLEAPLLFRRENLYYVLCGPLCADCPQGSEVLVNISTSPFGPYHYAGDINHRPDIGDFQSTGQAPTPPPEVGGHTNTFSPHPHKNPYIRGQETWVARLPTAGMPSYIWMADGWETAGDGMKGHDLQYWSAPLKFNADGTIQPLKFAPRWGIKWVKKE